MGTFSRRSCLKSRAGVGVSDSLKDLFLSKVLFLFSKNSAALFFKNKRTGEYDSNKKGFRGCLAIVFCHSK